jgi:hypothetical protein
MAAVPDAYAHDAAEDSGKRVSAGWLQSHFHFTPLQLLTTRSWSLFPLEKFLRSSKQESGFSASTESRFLT